MFFGVSIFNSIFLENQQQDKSEKTRKKKTKEKKTIKEK